MKRLLFLLIICFAFVCFCQAGNANDLDSIRALNDFGNESYDKNDYTQAETYFLRALTMQESCMKESDEEFLTTLNNIGLLYLNWGKYSQAMPYLERQLHILEGLGVLNEDLALAYSNTAWGYEMLMDYAKAVVYETKGLEVRQKIYPEENELISASYNNLGLLYKDMGNYTKAADCTQRSLDICRKLNKTNDESYATSLENMAVIKTRQGEYQAAEACLEKADTINKSLFGENSISYANLLNNRGALYLAMGDYARAESDCQQALEIRRQKFGPDHPIIINTLRNLAVLSGECGKYDKMEQYYFEAADITEKTYGKKSLMYIAVLGGLGASYHYRKDYDNAERYYLQQLEGLDSLDREQYVDAVLVANNNLAKMYEDQGKYTEAEHYYLQALTIFNNHYGEAHQNSIKFFDNLGRLYCQMKEYKKSEYYCKLASNRGRKLFINTSNYLSERQRNMVWEAQVSYSMERLYPSLAYKCYPVRRSISSFAYDNEIFRKGALLRSSNAIRYSILESGDTTLIRQWNELTEKKQQLIALEGKNANPSYLEQIRVEAETLEKELTKKSAAYRENIQQWSITWDSVRNVLQPKQVAIEFMAAPLSADTTVYCALLVRHNSKQPELIPLFNLRDIQPILAHKDPNRIYLPREHGLALKNAIWGKVLPRLKAGETVYFAPTGVLHQIAIEHLPFDENHTMNEIYNLRRLSSTRELVLHHSLDSPLSTATLYGGIHYSLSDTTMAKNAAKSTTKTRGTATRELEVKGRKILVADTLEDLPGTKIEVEHIRMLLDSMHIRAQVYMADTASEESFRALSGQHRNILHLATHGFFNEDTENTIDPMERSGLIFAGANKAWSGHREEIPDGVQDGILLAKEISDLDLRDANLVVLSACQTGLGDITGEGVFGLQRAFKMAGVQTIVMSLWPVNDQATQILMTALYRNLAAGQSKHEAFRNAQRAVRDYVPGPDEPPTLNVRLPRFWAGFILLD